MMNHSNLSLDEAVSGLMSNHTIGFPPLAFAPHSGMTASFSGMIPTPFDIPASPIFTRLPPILTANTAPKEAKTPKIFDLVAQHEELRLAIEIAKSSALPNNALGECGSFNTASPTKPAAFGLPVQSVFPGWLGGDNNTSPTMHSNDNKAGLNESQQAAGAKPRRTYTRCRRPAGAWTAEEHEKFLKGLEKFRTEDTQAVKNNGEPSVGLGPGIAEIISVFIGTRTVTQVRSHAQKYFQRQQREQGQVKV
mmetsp:Transcript_28614/g.58482  ORF Transcript_28614/g.58482 Transcript_28614/m.58482 type:complete len:250 (-) Transcript_28614:66-815(-)|eukprot:CAMPEP_0181316788 /NCGR_PEP_ID=MMETSP1101-20121128/16083_1 /TAXON_ID=46948 /ORGANISM="Rhodomonas abbreviata, Strain Caron Lab Isolate" /LENGTH=249 /DNA_ID=CAMNT_0023424061 /DNA_START=52 /DNA_END=801 /DNA_ORIENTATION=+